MNHRLIPALFLIVLGALFLLDNLGLAHMDVGNLIATWWPMFLIAAGVRQVLR
ncbi:LiaI-LiaF-like domain-containing protein, partial [Xanthomonas bromi]